MIDSIRIVGLLRAHDIHGSERSLAALSCSARVYMIMLSRPCNVPCQAPVCPALLLTSQADNACSSCASMLLPHARKQSCRGAITCVGGAFRLRVMCIRVLPYMCCMWPACCLALPAALPRSSLCIASVCRRTYGQQAQRLGPPSQCKVGIALPLVHLMSASMCPASGAYSKSLSLMVPAC